jgi:hypothetical protein
MCEARPLTKHRELCSQVHQPAASATAGKGLSPFWLGYIPHLQPDSVAPDGDLGQELHGGCGGAQHFQYNRNRTACACTCLHLLNN